jgi:hypothetical protein
MLLASLHSHSRSVQNPRTAWERVNRRELDGRVGVCERLDSCHTCFVKGERQSKIHLAFVEQF